ncbi:MAG: nucleoside 2-deoxyribosyltransferase [Oscillospiraceae bacterium]|nr:nucleoside 2-deoxyribosyltransferase [Oscillospiraceae bacterium]
MRYCYNIYPSNSGKIAEVFSEVIEPMVKACGYELYSFERQSAVGFAVDTAEKFIAACDVCVADISTDSPNVWYEIGFAYSAGKRVILLCSDERDTPYPFSINHRYIVAYSTNTLTDVGLLKQNLQRRLIDSDVADKVSPLSELDVEVLNFINNLQDTPHEAVPKEKITASKADVQYALKRLVDRKYIEYIYSVNESEQRSSYYRVTQKGLDLLNGYLSGESIESLTYNSSIRMGHDGANGLQIGQVSGGTINVMLPDASNFL